MTTDKEPVLFINYDTYQTICIQITLICTND